MTTSRNSPRVLTLAAVGLATRVGGGALRHFLAAAEDAADGELVDLASASNHLWKFNVTGDRWVLACWALAAVEYEPLKAVAMKNNLWDWVYYEFFAPATRCFQERFPQSPALKDCVGVAHGCYAHRLDDGRMDQARLAVLCDAAVDAGLDQPCGACSGRGKIPYCGRWMFSCAELGIECDCKSTKQCELCGGEGTKDGGAVKHLREVGPHFRGCWAVDWILGLR